MNKDYFFDSYALIELIKGSEFYKKFINERVNITIFNLLETYWHFLLKDEDLAEAVYSKYPIRLRQR